MKQLLIALALLVAVTAQADTTTQTDNNMIGGDSTKVESQNGWNHRYRWACYARNGWGYTFYWVNWHPSVAQQQAMNLCTVRSYGTYCWPLGCRYLP